MKSFYLKNLLTIHSWKINRTDKGRCVSEGKIPSNDTKPSHSNTKLADENSLLCILSYFNFCLWGFMRGLYSEWNYLAPVVQRATPWPIHFIHWIATFPLDKVICFNRGLRGLDSKWIHLAPVAQRADNFIQWIKCIPTNTFYPLDNNLSAG